MIARPSIRLLSEDQVRSIHDTSLQLLGKVGVRVHHETVLRRLADAGAMVDAKGVARFPESIVMHALSLVPRQYTLHGRDAQRVARFGVGDLNLMSSPGQAAWIDQQTSRSRPATVADARSAILLGEALPNITIVGAMAQPAELPPHSRAAWLAAELVKGAAKPTRCWVQNLAEARAVLEIYRTVAGGAEALRRRPMTEAFLGPISPLQMPRDALDTVIEFVVAGQPITIGSMVMACGTAPATLAGAVAQDNAEILAGIVITQTLGPGTPILYGGIPHILDPRTTACSFGSPEQGLTAIAMTQLGRSYGLPVYVNVGLTDSCHLDLQAGIEKAATLVQGALAGADLFGHAGICGADHGASLLSLATDDQVMQYVRRVVRGFDVTPCTLATGIIAGVGPGGNFLAEEHTAANFRNEIWLCDSLWSRSVAGTGDDSSMAQRLSDRVMQILADQTPTPMDPAIAKELDRIVRAAGDGAFGS